MNLISQKTTIFSTVAPLLVSCDVQDAFIQGLQRGASYRLGSLPQNAACLNSAVGYHHHAFFSFSQRAQNLWLINNSFGSPKDLNLGAEACMEQHLVGARRDAAASALGM